MIIELSVKNFGPIKDTQTLSMIAGKDDGLEDYYIVNAGGLRLLRFAILYGPNASGKSTFLKALDFLSKISTKPTNDKLEPLNFKPFEFDADWKSANSSISLAFLVENIKHIYEVTFNNEYIVSEKLVFYPDGRPATIYARSTDPNKELAKLTFGSTMVVKKRDRDLLEGNTIWNNTVLAGFAKTNVDIPELQNVKEWFSEYYLPVVRPATNLTGWATKYLNTHPELKGLVTELMQKADIQISGFKVEQHEIQLEEEEKKHVVQAFETLLSKATGQRDMLMEDKPAYLRNSKIAFEHAVLDASNQLHKYLLDAREESAGTMRYFGLSTILATISGKAHVLPIDEIEASLHPDLMKHFVLTFLANARPSQMIMTTHNLSFLEERDILRNDCVWFTQKRADGAVELYSAADFDTSIIRKDSSISNAYKIGKLGAKPVLGNIFYENTTHPDWF